MSKISDGAKVRLVEYSGLRWTESRRDDIGRIGILAPDDGYLTGYRWVDFPEGDGVRWDECGLLPVLTRRIVLTLADDYCQYFDEGLYVPSDLPAPHTSYRAQRSATCIAAEVK